MKNVQRNYNMEGLCCI